MEIIPYLTGLRQAESDLTEEHENMVSSYFDDSETVRLFVAMAVQSRSHAHDLMPLVDHYAETASPDTGSVNH